MMGATNEPRWTDPCSVDVVMWATGASAEIAREYLIAEEGDIDNAIISYKLTSSTVI